MDEILKPKTAVPGRQDISSQDGIIVDSPPTANDPTYSPSMDDPKDPRGLINKASSMKYEGSEYEDKVTSALNSIEGSSYESPYKDQIQSVLNELTSAKFDYDPETDQSLQGAKKIATRNVFDQMGARGILSSTITAQGLETSVAELIPAFRDQAFGEFRATQQDRFNLASTLNTLDQSEYGKYSDQINTKFELAGYYNDLAKQDYTKFTDEVNSLYKQAEMINTLDFQEYTKYSDQLDRDYRTEKFDFEKQQVDIDNKRNEVIDAWTRVEQMGHVDNETSITLGVEPGTLSRSAREAAQRLQDALKLEQQKLQNSIALSNKEYKQRQSLIAQKQKADAINDPATIFKNSSTEQIATYNKVRQQWLDPNNKVTGGDPVKALGWFAKTEKMIVDVMGSGLANVLKTEMQSFSNNNVYNPKEKEATVGATKDQQSDELMTAFAQDGLSTDEMLDVLQNDKAIINGLGWSKVNEMMLNLTQGRKGYNGYIPKE